MHKFPKFICVNHSILSKTKPFFFNISMIEDWRIHFNIDKMKLLALGFSHCFSHMFVLTNHCAIIKKYIIANGKTSLTLWSFDNYKII